MASQFLTATDGLVIVMLTMMALSLGVVAMLFLCMRRNDANRDRQLEDLLEEVAEEEKREKTHESPRTEPWEKNADWWK